MGFALLGVVWALTTGVYGGEPLPPEQGAAATYFTWRLGTISGSCSGALVAPEAVLTAAHCVRALDGRARRVRRVRMGNRSTQAIRVAEARVHPRYDPAHPERGFDVAVLRLVEGARATPIALVRDDARFAQGEPLRVWGFGRTRARGAGGPRLREARLELLSPFHCFHGDVRAMARTRSCAASPRAGVCPGDSGAPVLAAVEGELRQLGIVSLAIDRTRRCQESATVMTRVAAFADWIAGASR
ncbi:MAG: trypsin-like serine protease [Myxococcota bacterium]